jgi:aspartate/methionine/tyrosine aminotransferase
VETPIGATPPSPNAGFLAGADLTENPIEQARRNTRDYIDLTSSNPTHQGLLFPAGILRIAANTYWDARRYSPAPKGVLAARQSITNYYLQRTPGIALDPDHIVITASTSEAYGLLFTLLTEPGDNVLGPAITYPLFEHLAEAHHIELRTYEMDESRGWGIDEDSLLDVVDDRTRAVLIVSPHNPTGMIVQRSLPALDQLNLPVICDEVFAEFTFTANATPPFNTLHPNLPVLVLNGISKMFALPDLKLGWVAMNAPAHAQFGERLEFLNDAYLSANSLTQHMLPALFEHGMPFVKEMRTRINTSLAMALEMLSACPAIEVQPPAGGYYLFPKVRGWDDEEALVLHLLKHGVLVHPGFFYGNPDGAHLMISCLTEPAMLREGLRRLVSALQR